jgi:hypothetical protein
MAAAIGEARLIEIVVVPILRRVSGRVDPLDEQTVRKDVLPRFAARVGRRLGLGRLVPAEARGLAEPVLLGQDAAVVGVGELEARVQVLVDALLEPAVRLVGVRRSASPRVGDRAQQPTGVAVGDAPPVGEPDVGQKT